MHFALLIRRPPSASASIFRRATFDFGAPFSLTTTAATYPAFVSRLPPTRRQAKALSTSFRTKSNMALSSSAMESNTQQFPSSDGSMVDLMELAAAAVACTVSASRAILKIAHPDGEKNTRTKDDGSFVTDADVAAQFVIVRALQTVSRSVKIVGEESQEEMEQLQGDYDFLDPDILQKTRQEMILRRKHGRPSALLNDDSQSTTSEPPPAIHYPLARRTTPEQDNDATISTSQVQEEEEEIPVMVEASRVCVIVDPLDGTKSYAAGEHDVVSILIGIILDNKPYFGVVGKPFGYSSLSPILDTNCVTIYGGPLIDGVFVAGGAQVIPKPIQSLSVGSSDQEPPPGVDMPRAVISSSRSKGVVHDFCLHLGQEGLIHPQPLLISGAGEKSLRLILQRHNEAVWFYPKPGTSLWDVAAPDALLRSLGGKLTDKYGNEMDYSKSRDEFENMDGVVACIDSTLHTKCIKLFQEGDWIDRQ